MRRAGLTRARRRGLTLIELMLTMGLLALVIGVGIGSLSSLNPGQRAAVGIVQGPTQLIAPPITPRPIVHVTPMTSQGR